MKKEVIIYQSKSGAIELKGDFSHETIWATQAQIAKMFNTTPQNITLHLKNVYKEKELQESATCKEFLQVQKEGKKIAKRSETKFKLLHFLQQLKNKKAICKNCIVQNLHIPLSTAQLYVIF